MKNEIRIYQPNQRLNYSFFKVFFVMIKNIISSKELIIQLFKRDFLAVYKKSFLGLSWVVIMPILGVVSWVFMNAAGVLNPGDVGIPYPAYVLLSMTIWGMFMGFFTASSQTLQSGAIIIMQVKFPHEALLVKQIAQYLANFVLTFLLSVGILLFFDVTIHWMIILFPIVALPLFLIGTGVGLIVSVISAVTTEVNQAVTSLLGFFLFFTPVVYSPKFDNTLIQFINTWNPLSYLVNSVRSLVLYGTLGDSMGYFISAGGALAFFLIAWYLFYISEDKVIERMI